MTPRQKRYHARLIEGTETVMEGETDSLVEASRLAKHFTLQCLHLHSAEAMVEVYDREERRWRVYQQAGALVWSGIMTAIRDTK